MQDWIVSLIQGGGYWGIVFLMALENIFPPIPSELIMGVGGLAVAHGKMDLLPLLIAGTAGATLGNYVLFLVADRLGVERLKPFVCRHGRWLTLEWHEIETASRFMRKHGQWVVFFLRFMPLLRTVISIPAGLTHMRHWQFLVYTAAGAAVWNVLLVLGGKWLGQTFSDAETVLNWGVGGLFGVVLVFYVWRVFTWKPNGEVET